MALGIKGVFDTHPPLPSPKGMMSPSQEFLRLYQVSKTSEFEPAFERFHNSNGYKEVAGRLDGPGLEKFVDFLDEVRFSPYYPARPLTARAGAPGRKLERKFIPKSLARFVEHLQRTEGASWIVHDL